MRKTAFVKVSGDLFKRNDFIGWLRELTATHYTTILVGGGTQINEEFGRQGIKIDFGPLGRRIETFEHRQLARNILEQNQATVQDILAEKKIPAIVVIPVLDIGSVLCHINGDVYVRAAYLGFNDLYVITYESRMTKKGDDFKDLRRVQIIGFPDKLDSE